MFNCPLCGEPNKPDQRECNRCKADLTQYAGIYYAPDFLYNEAHKLSEKGEISNAIELLSSAHKLRPDDKGILEFLSDLYLKKEDFEMAMEKCLALIALDPQNAYAANTMRDIETIVDRLQEKKKVDGDLRSILIELAEIKAQLTNTAYSDQKRTDESAPPVDISRIEEGVRLMRTELNGAVEFEKASVTQALSMARHLRRTSIALNVVTILLLLGLAFFSYQGLRGLSSKTGELGLATEDSLAKMSKRFDNSWSDIQKKHATTIEHYNTASQAIGRLDLQLKKLSLQRQDLSNETVKRQLEEIRNRLNTLEKLMQGTNKNEDKP